MNTFFKSLLIVLFLSFISCKSQKIVKGKNVSTISELNDAIKNAVPGDRIVMKNGTWQDVVIKFNSVGTASQPITITAQTPGQVFIEGKSALTLGGKYLIVDGLYFKNGYTPRASVIAFQTDDSHIAFNSRVTNCVIEDFTQPDRHVKDHWVEFYGRNNELDHCYIAGKSNEGPTVKVLLDGNEHVYNYHKIHDNYFGERPRKGGPKAETIQIGESSTSMTPSYTQVTKNLFEKCNGEVEIISSKSNFNNFSHNIFLESEGSLVTRHGNYAQIDGNIFIGNDTPYIGGIRIINTGHRVTNNYFYNLRGDEFRSSLAIMNGIPKSALNRYNQVTDVVIAHNSWVNCLTPVQISVGSNTIQAAVLPESEIRSARPERVTFANNFIYNITDDVPIIKGYDKIDGFNFKENKAITINSTDTLKLIPSLTANSFPVQTIQEPKLSLIYPKNSTTLFNGFDFESIETDLYGNKRTSGNTAGAINSNVSNPKPLVDKSIYGPSWFNPNAQKALTETFIANNEQDFYYAFAKAKNGDIIKLTGSVYNFEQSIEVDKKIYIQGNAGLTSIISTAAETAFLLKPKGKLTLSGLTLSGNSLNHAFKTLDKNMSQAFGLALDQVVLTDFDSILEVSQGAFADHITIQESELKNCKNGLMLNKETRDLGDYNVEFLTVTNSNFANIKGTLIDFYRGGYDESTIGGVFTFTGNTVKNSGENAVDKILIKNRGIVYVDFSNNIFQNNQAKIIAILWGAKGQKPMNNTILNSGEIKVVENIEQKIVY